MATTLNERILNALKWFYNDKVAPEMSAQKTDIVNTIYPVGSIYISVNNVNPSTLFGGTWTAYGTSDAYLRLGGNGSGGQNSVSYTPAGSNSGGSVQNHTLTLNEIPSHRHTMSGCYAYGDDIAQTYIFAQQRNMPAANANSYTSYDGGGQGHNHGFTNPTFKGTAATIATEPKYVQVYAWKRTA